LIDIQTAYNDAKDEAVNSEDITLQSKKELIEHYMGCIKAKMLKIQNESNEIQRKIKQTMRNALTQMNDLVKAKASIL
jgi:BMFP domain-containing protein YqiC